jgi:hypothetical protein
MNRANSNEYLRLGLRFAPQMSKFATLDQVAKELNCTRQMAWYYTHVALGKLIYRLQREVTK